MPRDHECPVEGCSTDGLDGLDVAGQEPSLKRFRNRTAAGNDGRFGDP